MNLDGHTILLISCVLSALVLGSCALLPSGDRLTWLTALLRAVRIGVARR